MKLFHPCPAAAACLLFLLFQSSALAQFSGQTTTVTGPVIGNACGNTGGTDVSCTSTSIPVPGDPAAVSNNSLVVGTTGSVSGLPPYGEALVYGGITYGSGTVSDNRVDMRGVVSAGTSADASVIGGFSTGSGAVSNNRVDVSGTIISVGTYISASAIGGFSTGSGIVSNNRVTISGSITDGDAYGGRSYGSGDVTGNSAVVESGGWVSQNVYGGESYGSGDVTGNSAIVKSGGSVGWDVYGGFSYGSGFVGGNTVTIESGGSARDVFGGHAGDLASGSVDDNAVVVRGTVTRDAYGGYAPYSGDHGWVAPSSTFSGNSVTIENGGRVIGNAYGAYNGDIRPIDHSTVTVESGGSVDGNVYGGFGDVRATSDVTDNSVTINGTVGGSVYGGYISNVGSTTGNSVTISGSVGGDVYGGYALAHVSNNTVAINANMTGTVYGGYSLLGGTVSNNTVTISAAVGGDVYAGYGRTGTVSNNSAAISGSVGGNLIGGSGSGNGSVSGNTVTLSGSVGGDLIGGSGSGNGSVSGNTVTLSGSVGGDLVGGSSRGSGDVTDNTLIISGSVAGDVIAGYGSSTSTGTIRDNTVSLFQGATITGGVFGGVSHGTGSISGNTLNVNRFRGSVAEISGFEHYNFDLPLGLYAGNTLISITGAIATDLAGTTVNVSDQFSPGAFTTTGDIITLIDKANGSFTTSFAGYGYGGLSQVYELDLHDNAGALVLELISASTNPQTGAFSQALASEIITLNRATDLVAGSGLEQAKAALKRQGDGPALYTSLSYADTHTKSHIDSDGWAGLLGIAWDDRTPDNAGWMASTFFEFGQGDWEAYTRSAGHNTVYSSGETLYVGAGLLGEYRFASRLRFDASARIGHVETSDFKARNYAAGQNPTFDLGGLYYGIHVGTGYDVALDDAITLDLIARYLWTHRDGETVTILGERVRFDDIDSHRVRLGGRLNYLTNPVVRPYVGLYGEYEFAGTSKARNLTENIDHRSLKIRGGTGIAEMGVRVIPEDVGNLSLEVSVQGHLGQRDGIVGLASLTWKF